MLNCLGWIMRQARVRKRCFVQMIGYEPVSPEHQHRRFSREISRFQETWIAQTKVSPLRLSADGAVASWTADTSGPDWGVATDYHYFRWDDFVSADNAVTKYLITVPVIMNSSKAAVPSGKRHQSLSFMSRTATAVHLASNTGKLSNAAAGLTR